MSEVWVAVYYSDRDGANDTFIGVAASKEIAMSLTAPNLTWVMDDEGQYRAPLGRSNGYKVMQKVVVT